jgi:hypothetical protein
MSVPKLSSLVDLQHKVGELALSITCPSIIILTDTKKVLRKKMWLW